MEYSEESKIRIEKISKMKSLWIIPYFWKFNKKDSISELNKKIENNFRDIEEVVKEPKSETLTAGRLVLFRSFWKIAFWKLQDSTSEIQIMFSRENCKINTWKEVKDSLNEEMYAYKFIEKLVDVWDFIWVKWELFKTHKWELTVFVEEFTFLAKSIRPLPEKFHWISDQEAIYRQRYLDLIMNKESYERFLFRSEFVRLLREFYYKEGFIEIDTPVLWNAASGAAAKPFITHHNDFDEDFYLRISPETSLKKATVGRFEKVFEFSRNFRNEWSDPSHVQEFTSVEHYAAYWDYEDNMRFNEKMFDYLFEKLNLDKIVKIKDKQWNIKDVNFATPWERIDYIEWVKKETWIDITQYSIDDADRLRADIKAKWIEFEWMNTMWTATLVDYMYKKVLRPKILWPAFVYNYPKTLQPLARASDNDQNIVEQYQLLVNGWEVNRVYSELVDPILQKFNFDEQAKATAMWDEEATSWDDDFVYAMEYGMPPQSGFWMWIERIVSLLTWQDNLRDSILFPLTRGDK